MELSPPGTVNWLRETRMSNKKTRYFVAISATILAIGLGTGLVASYMGLPVSVFRAPPVLKNSNTCLPTRPSSPTPTCAR